MSSGSAHFLCYRFWRTVAVVLAAADKHSNVLWSAGKTIAFGVPALQHILTQKKHHIATTSGPYALVMAPTRELAQQITAEFDEKVGSKCGVVAYTVFGGISRKAQAEELRKKKPGLIVGTPGRTLDFIEDGTISLQV
jgi:superfamily II DNA/RNA helicase